MTNNTQLRIVLIMTNGISYHVVEGCSVVLMNYRAYVRVNEEEAIRRKMVPCGCVWKADHAEAAQ